MLEVKFYQNENLTDMSFYGDTPGEMIVIVPSPAVADEIRAGFQRNNSTSVPSVVTISKFLQDELKKSELPDEHKILKSKADLILNLARLWKLHLSHLSFEVFLKAYNHFSELRSHSLRLEIVTPIIEKLDPELEKAVKLFWIVTDAMDVVDEHRAYDLLSQYYRTDLIGEVIDKKNLVFLDFTFLSGLQLDLINALAIKHQVFVPFPLEVYQETTNEDWIKWLIPEHKDKTPKKDKPKLRTIDFPKKKLNLFLRKHIQDELTDFMLCSKNLEDELIFDIPVGDVYFKTQASIFNEEYNTLKNDFKNFSFPMTPASFKKSLTEWGKKTISTEQKNFRRFKIVSLMLEITKSYEELSSQELSIDHFDLKILLHVLQLRMPRTFLVPLIDNNQVKKSARILDLKNIQSFDQERKTFVCLGSDYSPIKLAEDTLTEFDFEILNSVGPIKRNQLDFLMTKLKLKKVLSSPNTTLFIEHDFQKHDLGWSEILADYDLIKHAPKEAAAVASPTIEYGTIFKKSADIKNHDLSANRLQSYLDCPQKFYYDHLEPLRPRINLGSSIQFSELGTIEHDVIEYYMKNISIYNADKITEISRLRLQHYLTSKNLILISQEFEKFSIEISLLAGQAVQFLNQLEKTMGKSEYYFEHSLNLTEDFWKVRIRVDCLIKTPQGHVLLDFKRSGSSVPKSKQFESFDKIQLWFYLHYLKIPENELALVGYLNLMQPEESLFYSTNEFEFLTELDIKINHFPKTLDEMMGDFSVLLQKTKDQMSSDKTFLPNPRLLEVCRYCSVAAVCSRGDNTKNLGEDFSE